MTTEIRESIALCYREGRSDKVYQVQLERVDAGFVVNFQFGRRGRTLQSGTKTLQPVSYNEAATIYERLVKEKKARGYTEDARGTPYQGAEQSRRPTGLLPQLLNPVDESEAEKLIADVSWFMQEKKDGHRMLIRKIGDTVQGSTAKVSLSACRKRLSNPCVLSTAT